MTLKNKISSMRFYVLPLIGFLFFASCEEPKKETLGQFKSDYYRIPAEDLVGLAKQGKLNYTYAKFMNVDGTVLTAEDQKKLNSGLLGKDYFSDPSGKIVEVRVRELEQKDKLIEIQRRELAQDPFSAYRKLKVNCDSLDVLYSYMERTDQEVRHSKPGNLREVDHKNQEALVSALNQCGWSDSHLSTIWLVIQHSPTALMAYYYADLKKAVEARKLDPSKLALLEDRLLMRHGYKQMYGTQIMDGKLYDLEHPDKINLLRQEMGLQSIEKYLTHFDLDWEVEKKRMITKEE